MRFCMAKRTGKEIEGREEMLQAVVVAIINVFEILITYLFFKQQGKEKYKRWISLSVGAGLALSATLVYYIVPYTTWVNGLYLIVAHFVFGLLMFHIHWSRVLFGSVVLMILSTALEFATISGLAFFTKRDMEYHLQMDHIAYFILLACISKLLYFLCSMLLARLIQPEKTRIRFPKVYYVYPFAAVSVLLLIWQLYVSVEIPSHYLLLFSLICLFLLLSVILLFVSYQSTVQKENTIRFLQSEADRIETDQRYYSVLEKQNENLRIYAHDMKKHLNAIRALNEDAQIDAYLNQMSERLREYSQIGNTGNRMLDIICSKYAAECENKHIELHTDFRFANFTYIENYDLVTIFGNLLDNAVEAAEQTEERLVVLKTAQKNHYDVVVIENSCAVPPHTENRELKTTKARRELHGLGLKSVAKVLKKYGSDYDWHYDEAKKRFYVTVMIAPPKSEDTNSKG